MLSRKSLLSRKPLALVCIVLCVLGGVLTASSTSAADCMVVCPSDFRPALEGWLAYRRAQGFEVMVVPSATDATSLRRLLRQRGLDDATRAIVLIGDCRIEAPETANVQTEVPTFYETPVATKRFQATPSLASDAPYGDLNEDGVPDVAVGRLPIDTPQELIEWTERIRVYEASQDFGLWRDRVQITAGVGGFGYLADTAIESATRSILTSSLPAAVRLAVTYASPTSPFYPGAIDFFPATLRRYREGGLFWVYLGHGQVTELDRVPGPNGTRRSVLDSQDVTLLERPASAAPIALLLACYTGAYDARVDCLAERMVKAEGGPIAVLAGSRVTMPYGNAVAAQGLIHAVYQQRSPTLGAAWLAAQQELAAASNDSPALAKRRQLVDLLASILSPDSELLPGERLEHARIYNLLGDPLLRIRHPEPLQLEVPRVVEQGAAFQIRGTSPCAGKLHVTLCHLPGAVPVDAELSQSERYEQANCLDITSHEIPAHNGGEFELRVDVPPELVGRVRVIARVENKDGWATAASSLLIRPSQP